MKGCAQQVLVKGRLPLACGLGVSTGAASKVWRRIAALLLLFFGAAIWWSCRPDYRPIATAGLPTATMRQLQDANASCDCVGRVDEDIGLLMVSKSHLTTQATYNSLCSRKGTVCVKDGQQWVLAAYFAGLCYMFVALAIVCDEFFVPSLECFSQTLDISPDVAGATFMAAGGSMPELFTSFIGTFKETSVGIGTIVGSAVFNVLFVIAVCAVASDEVLTLTWWPLARDCSYYMFACATLALFFSGPWSKDRIDWWEALILLAEYFGYCLLMKFNDRVYSMVAPTMGGTTVSVVPEVMPAEEGGQRTEASAWGVVPTIKLERRVSNPWFLKSNAEQPDIMELLVQNEHISDTVGMAVVMKIEGSLHETFEHIDKDSSGHIDGSEFQQMLEDVGVTSDSMTKESIMQYIGCDTEGNIGFEEFKRWYNCSEARIEMKMRRIFNQFDPGPKHYVEHSDVLQILGKLGHRVSDEDVVVAMEQMLSVCSSSASDESNPPRPPLPQVRTKRARASQESQTQQKECGTRGARGLSKEKLARGFSKEMQHMLGARNPSKELHHVPDARGMSKDLQHVPQHGSSSPRGLSEEDRVSRIKCVDVAKPAVTIDDLSAWYRTSGLWKTTCQAMRVSLEMPVDVGMSLDVPRNASKGQLAWYVLTYPLCAAMYITMPDVRRSSSPSLHRAFLEFFLSLMWIAFFATCLVEWTEVISNTLGVPLPVAGVTVLAAGTSVPDLLSSYVVARQGQADMAVSSSIGSNIFDVTVGLPLPWLCWSALNDARSIPVDASGVGFFVFLLVAMVASVVLTVKTMNWRMTRNMGYVMFALYFTFIILFLLVQMPEGNPIVSAPF